MSSQKLSVLVVMLCFVGSVSASFVDQSQITLTVANERLAGAWASNLINDSGLNPDLTLNKDATDLKNWLCNIDYGRWLWNVPNAPQRNYSPSGIQGEGWIQFEFATPQQITNMMVWNYNNPNYLSRGWESAAIDYSLDGVTWIRYGGQGIYTHFNQAPGTDNYACNNIFDFGGQAVKKVVLTCEFATGNYGDPSWTGLSEVKFELVPEPATMILLGIGSLGLISRKRG